MDLFDRRHLLGVALPLRVRLQVDERLSTCRIYTFRGVALFWSLRGSLVRGCRTSISDHRHLADPIRIQVDDRLCTMVHGLKRIVGDAGKLAYDVMARGEMIDKYIIEEVEGRKIIADWYRKPL